MRCGLVMLNYNDYQTTIKSIMRVKDFPEIEHVAIVDNNSPNNSYNELKTYQSEKISVMQSGKNGGYSYGNNFGARYLIEKCNPEIICIANPDVEFDDNFVRVVKELFASNPDYSIITGIEHDEHGDTIPAFYEDESGVLSSYKSLLDEIFMMPLKKVFRVTRPDKHRRHFEEIISSHEILNPVWAVSGCLFFVRVKDFEAMNYLDENVFMYNEERIIGCKIQRMGKKIGIANNISYTHARVHTALTPEERYRSGMTLINRANKSRNYYFSHYVTGNKFLQAIHSFLVWLLWLKPVVAYKFRNS